MHSDLKSAIAQLNTQTSDTKAIYRTFVIGGASLYTETLALQPSSMEGFVDRVLLTRILSPAFDECDVFMPDFLGKGNDGVWTRASHNALSEWVGLEVPEGVQQEKGVDYEFQMWVREN